MTACHFSDGRRKLPRILGLISTLLLMPPSASAALPPGWPSIAGQIYQLEYKDDLAAPAWTPLGSPVTGNDGTLSATNSVGVSGQQFFRLRLVN